MSALFTFKLYVKDIDKRYSKVRTDQHEKLVFI